MFYKIAQIDKQPTFSYITKEQSGDSLPEPYVECTENEFIQACSLFVPEHIQYCQVVVPSQPDKKYVRNSTIFFLRDRAVAIVWPIEWRCGKKDVEPPVVYTEPIRYFRIGCIHAWQELSQSECTERGVYHAGRCYHVYECTKCKFQKWQDSSD